MNNTFLLLLVAAALPQNTAQDAGLVAAHDYASCVGMSAVLNSATMPSIEEALTAAFNQCSAKREAALTAVAASLQTHGMSAPRATQEADQMFRENDRVMANELRADIATFRRTGQPAANAPN